MINKIGEYIFEKFKDKDICLFMGYESEYINYFDTSTFNRTIVVGKVAGYDANANVLELKNAKEQSFFVNCYGVQIFWSKESGVNILESFENSINTGKKPRSPDAF